MWTIGVVTLPKDYVLVAFMDHIVEFTPQGNEVSSASLQNGEKFICCPAMAVAYNFKNNKIYVCRVYCVTVLNHDLTIYTTFGKYEFGKDGLRGAEDIN